MSTPPPSGMSCPHCGVTIHANWSVDHVLHHRAVIGWLNCVAQCPSCREYIIALKPPPELGNIKGWAIVVPRARARAPVPAQVPPEIREDYEEACEVLYISAKASAAL